MHNICELSKLQQRDTQLSRRASLLINDMRIGRKNRADINRELDSLECEEKEVFRFYLNKYKG